MSSDTVNESLTWILRQENMTIQKIENLENKVKEFKLENDRLKFYLNDVVFDDNNIEYNELNQRRQKQSSRISKPCLYSGF